MTNQEIIDAFHVLYYGENERSPIINSTKWMGVAIQKCPCDLWIYSEIMYEVKPRLIIETGTLHGGSALWFAQMLDIIHHGEIKHSGYNHLIISIDIKPEIGLPKWHNLEYMRGSSTNEDLVKSLTFWSRTIPPVMVVLDSDHRAEHVYKELDIYSKFVTPGSYLIVEDTDANGHPILPRHGPGPMEAVHDWLPNHPEFEIDKSREKFLMTCNPDGYLRRKT